MEVRKVNGFFIIFVIGYIGLSVVCASIMAYAQNSGIAVPDWIQYVMFSVLSGCYACLSRSQWGCHGL